MDGGRESAGNPISDRLSEGRALHLQGRLGEAGAIYAEVLTAAPDHPEALHLSGVLALHSGKPEQAVTLIDRAIAADPSQVNYHNNLGNALLALSRYEEAASAYQRATDLDPSSADSQYNLANALLRLNRHREAIAAFRRSIELDPSATDAHYNLGMALLSNQDAGGAALHLERAVELDPTVVYAHVNLATALTALGRDDDALACLDRAIRSCPDNAVTWTAIGRYHLDQGRPQDALGYFTKSATLEPGSVMAQANLALAHEMGGSLAGAVRHLEQAIGIDPSFADGYAWLGEIESRRGNLEAAVRAFERASTLDPNNLFSKWGALLLLPPLYDNEDEVDSWRQHWAEGLTRFDAELSLDSPENIARALDVISQRGNFYLPYQGRDDRNLQTQFGAMVRRIAASAYPQHTAARTKRYIAPSDRIRVGFYSAHLHFHTVYKLFGRWITELDRRRFETVVFYSGKKLDAATAELAECAGSYFRDFQCLDDIVESIAAADLDALIFTDIGMDHATKVVAALRLAPVQCVTWGHPMTTGLPTIDYFLTSDLMEVPDGASHYSEHLVRLPNLSVSFRPPEIAEPPPAAEIRDGPVYLCVQSLYKLLPRSDALFAQIASAVEGSQIWFIEHNSAQVTEKFRNRLARCFATHGVAAEGRLVMQPQTDIQGFFRLIRRADVILDSPIWSGGNSTLEAIACAKPVVTVPGHLMRGCHTMGILRRLGVTETIAGDDAEYVALATRLGHDAAWREEISQRMAGALPRVYHDDVAIRGLEDFLETALKRTPEH